MQVCSQLWSQLHLWKRWIECCTTSPSVALPITKNKKQYSLVSPKVIFLMSLSTCEYLFSPSMLPYFGTVRVCGFPCVCLCVLVSKTRPSISDSPICEQQPCLLIPRPESSSSLSTGKRAASTQDELGGAGGGEEGGRLLSSSGDKSFFTPTPNFHTFLSPHAVYSPHWSCTFLLSIFQHPSPLSLPGLIYSSFQNNPFHLPSVLLSPFPVQAATFSHCQPFFSLWPPTPFPFSAAVQLSFQRNPFPYLSFSLFSTPPFLAVSPKLSPSCGQSIFQSQALLPSICFTSSSVLTLITHHRHIFFSTFCLSVSIAGQGTAGIELMGWNSALWWIFIPPRQPLSPVGVSQRPSSPQMPPSICHRRDRTNRKVSWAKAEEGATEPPRLSLNQTHTSEPHQSVESLRHWRHCPRLFSPPPITDRSATQGAESWWNTV